MSRRLAPWLSPLAAVTVFTACTDDEIPSAPEAVTVERPAEAESCETCHPRQYQEWVGSSHNYGGGLDPTYQALEIGANYYQFARGAGRVRDNLLCISCHAPSAAAYLDGFSNTNTQYRSSQVGEIEREIARSTEDALLAPPAVVTEESFPADIMELMQEDPLLATRRLRIQRQITYQGITCDTCHKVGRPLDDVRDENIPELIRRDAAAPSNASHAQALEQLAAMAETACTGPTTECAAVLREHCLLVPGEPRCRRVARNAEWDGEDYVDIGASNLAHVYERETDIRYAQFEQGDAATNIAHGVGTAATPEYEAVNMAFEGQPDDVRPYLQTGLFCGGCHDVRLPPLAMDPSRPGNLTQTSTAFNPSLEPLYNEPFLRLENLYTEWFTSALNLHPDSDLGTNPYLDAAGDPKRVVCQDCHMSLYPYAPPGTYPGAYTASAEDCDETGVCGETIALETDSETGERVTRANLRVQRRDRVTTHNLTGVDEGLGFIPPTPEQLYGDEVPEEIPLSLTLPNQRSDGDPSPVGQQPGRRPATSSGLDEVYNLPLAISDRRKKMLETAATVSLAGTPDRVDLNDQDCFDDNGLCCDPDTGECNIPIKVWGTNVNGGHNVGAGFSQERQMWVQFTVQDMGRVDENGNNPVVDCQYAEIDDFYQQVSTRDGRYPVFENPVPHTALSANEVTNRMFGVAPENVNNRTMSASHSSICRGMSGHLLDKPHSETNELQADGRVDDEDVLLHRIGNTLPETFDANNLAEPSRYMESWHVLDLSLEQLSDTMRQAGRNDQFHVPGNDAFQCELSRNGNASSLASLPMVFVDPVTGAEQSIPLNATGEKRFRVTDTSDERYEILYPFPEYREFMPFFEEDGSLHAGERFGLVYFTNIFYSVCGCDATQGTCVGPTEVTLPPYKGKPGVTMTAQTPWSLAFPSLPHTRSASSGEGDDVYHFPGFSDTVVDEYFAPFMEQLAASGRNLAIETSRHGRAGEERDVYRTLASRVFTFVPLNSNHMPNNRALRMLQPQRQYYDIRIETQGENAVVGPLRVSAKLYFRHFPPEFLRLMARVAEGAYSAAVAQERQDAYFPNGPLVVEGPDATSRWPDTGNVDQLDLVLMDEAVAYIDVPTQANRPAAAQALIDVPANPTWAEHVRPIMEDNCVPCHGDVLRQGDFVLSYDEFTQWDDPASGEARHAHQDPLQNMVGVKSAFLDTETLVVPGDPEASFLYRTLVEDEPDEDVRRMPLLTDKISPREIEIIRNWIQSGAN